MVHRQPLDPTTSLDAWTRAIAAPTASPAGGSVAAITAALGAALVAMVGGLTATRDRYATVHADARRALGRAEQLRRELLDLAAEDAKAFAEFAEALALPKTTEEERHAREEAKRTALVESARVQLEVAQRAAEVAELAGQIADTGLTSASGDATTAVFIAAAATRSAYWAVLSDLAGAAGIAPTNALWLDTAQRAVERAGAAERQLLRLLEERIGST